MFWRKKEPYTKTPLQVLEEHLIRMHSDNRAEYSSYDRRKCIESILSHVMEINKTLIKELIPSRIKSLEENVADLFLTGRNKDIK